MPQPSQWIEDRAANGSRSRESVSVSGAEARETTPSSRHMCVQSPFVVVPVLQRDRGWWPGSCRGREAGARRGGQLGRLARALAAGSAAHTLLDPAGQLSEEEVDYHVDHG